MNRKSIRNRNTNRRLFDAVYDDNDHVNIEVKLGKGRTAEVIPLEDVLQQIEEGKNEK